MSSRQFLVIFAILVSSLRLGIHTSRLPHRPMETHRRRPAMSPADAKEDIGVQAIGAAMTTMTVTGVPTELCIPTLEETAMRPSSSGSGKKKQWHRKKASPPPAQEIHILSHVVSDDTHHPVIFHGGSGDAESTTTSTTWPMVDSSITGGGKTNATRGTEITTNKNGSGGHLQLKNTKPVVVEISSTQLHKLPKKKPPSLHILPGSNYRVVAGGAAGMANIVSPTSIEDGGGNNGYGQRKKMLTRRKKKKNPKNQQNQQQTAKLNRDSSDNVVAAAAADGGAGGGSYDFYNTNEGGVSVLSLLGQYPYVMPSAFDDSYDRSGEHHFDHAQQLDTSSMIYPPTSSAYVGPHHEGGGGGYDVHYPYIATTQVHNEIHHLGPPPAGTAVIMPGGYYVPVIMHDDTVYYSQPSHPQCSATGEHAVPYYHHHATCYSPYAGQIMMDVSGYNPCPAPPSSVHQTNDSNNEGGSRIKSPLNIDAPAFDPSIKDYGTNHKNDTKIKTTH